MVTNGSLRVRSKDQSVSTKWVAGCKLTPCRNHSVRDVLCVRQARMQRKIYDGTCRLTEIDWRISIVSDLNEESNMESASSITKYDKSEKNKRSKKKKRGRNHSLVRTKTGTRIPEVSKKPVTGPPLIRPLTAVCLVREQAFVFGFCLTTPFLATAAY